MTKYKEHSDYSDTDTVEVVYDRGPKWTPDFQYDAAGYVVGRVGWSPPTDDGGKRFMEAAIAMRHRYPLPEIVMPNPRAMFGDGLLTTWPVDEDGRGLSVQEVKGDAYMVAQEIEQRRSLRAWERQGRAA